MQGLGILLALLASAAIHFGKVFQRQGVRSLPHRFSFSKSILQEYYKSRVYIGGLLLDITGGILTAVALSLAPVSTVQPVVSSGLVFVALYSHFVLKERLSRGEWVACLWAIVGLILLSGAGLSLIVPSEGADGMHPLHPTTPSTFNPHRLWPGLAAAVWILTPTAPTRQRFLQQAASKLGLSSSALLRGSTARLPPLHSHSSGNPTSPTPAGRQLSASQGPQLGLQAGACFGLSGASMKVGFEALPAYGLLATIAAVALSLSLTSRGIYLQTLGFKTSTSAVHIITLAAAGAMICSILCGIVLLNETIADSPLGLVSRILGWILMTAGILVMGRNPHVHQHQHKSSWAEALSGTGANSNTGASGTLLPVSINSSTALSASGVETRATAAARGAEGGHGRITMTSAA